MNHEHLLIILYATILIELFTAILGTVYFWKYKNTKLHNFIYLLWLSAINEVVTGIFLKRLLNLENLEYLYNIYYVIYFCLYFVIFKKYLLNNKYKITVSVFIYTYLVSLIINGFYQNYITDLQIVPYILASCFLIIIIIMYYIEILQSHKVLNIKKNLLFWISIGLLIHSVGSIPFRILRNYYENLTDGDISFLTTVILTITMNTCFIIGFIWSDKKQQY